MHAERKWETEVSACGVEVVPDGPLARIDRPRQCLVVGKVYVLRKLVEHEAGVFVKGPVAQQNFHRGGRKGYCNRRFTFYEHFGDSRIIKIDMFPLQGQDV